MLHTSKTRLKKKPILKRIFKKTTKKELTEFLKKDSKQIHKIIGAVKKLITLCHVPLCFVFVFASAPGGVLAVMTLQLCLVMQSSFCVFNDFQDDLDRCSCSSAIL